MSKVETKGEGDYEVDWVWAWRNGTKLVIHIIDAHAHWKFFIRKIHIITKEINFNL